MAAKLNPDFNEKDISRELSDLKITLENAHLGREFYNKIINQNGFKFIDLQNVNNNKLQVLTELKYKNGEDEFRPDISILINVFRSSLLK